MAPTAPARPQTSTSPAYDDLMTRVREASLLGKTLSMLHWDQEVLMPPEGVELRARQNALLARLYHQAATDERIGELLSECEADAGLTADQVSDSAVNLRELRRSFDRLTRLPESLVEEEARLASIGQHHWAEARRTADFSKFQPDLERIVELMRRKAECYGWPEDGEPWDALAEDYEPGCTARDVEAVFTPLRDRLQSLLDDLMGGAPPSNAFNELALPVDQQEQFVRFVAEQYGFDFRRGRMDVSTHPFCSGFSAQDVRITTRFHEVNVNDALGSVMHETGHGLYEQGLPVEHDGTPRGDSVSLGIHESQSRMWENQVGRSPAFWRWCHPKLNDFFGSSVDGMSFEVVFGGANIVRPDFIRVEADEATYNMHIMVRFEIERALLGGDLEVADIPEVWNEKYKQYLGITVPDDAKGCLQDIHWSGCSMGYFPTYTLGNLYAAQLFEKANEDLPDLDGQFERGQFSELKRWLNENIHAHGMRYRAAYLCEHVTGKPLSADPLMRHLEGKLRPLYGV
jgi:carboxypeptidase Taq